MPVQNQQQTVETLIKLKVHYETEPEGMRDIFAWLRQKFPNIIPDYACNTDGCVGGTLVEFKRNNSEGLPKVIKQVKRYLVARNSVALLIPRYSLYIVINPREYTFIDNSNWYTKKKLETIIKGKWGTQEDLVKFLNRDEWLPGQIDEFSIVSYNDLYYSKHSSVKKEDFIDEIKAPKELFIAPYPWNEKGDMESGMLDCLGGRALKKRLGAFFTPNKYVEISTKYLRNAISRVPEGHDYIIVDRCAGTGNLEKLLTAEELSHCVLNTYVYAEWTTLKGLYEGRVRYIIPHTKDYKDPDGLLSDGDALTEEFNKIITNIIENGRKKANGKLVVIGLENPPYSEPQAEATRSGKTHKQSSWVKEQMKSEKCGVSVNDLVNQFIWSMVRWYADEYIIFSPIKYWKSQHLFDGKFNEGYLCNRKGFHANSEAAISLISWTTSKEKNSCLIMQSDLGKRVIKKIHKGIISLNPKNIDNGFASLYHVSGVPDFKNGALVNSPFNKHCSNIKINSSITLQTLPLWVANCHKSKDYTEKEIIMKSGDGGTSYQGDEDFLNDCLTWGCLTNMNKCISDNHTRNELCLSQNTEAGKLLNINKRNTDLLINWYKILESIKATEEYNPEFTYGLYQICRDINIKIETGDYTKRNEPITAHKYPELDNLRKHFFNFFHIRHDTHIQIANLR